MKDIEKNLREKYDNVEVPDYMFDTSRVFKRVEEEKKQKKMLSIAASIIVIILVAIALIIIMPNRLKEDEIVINEKANSNNTNIAGEISIINKDAILTTTQSNNVIILVVDKIIEYTIIDNIPYTKINASIKNTYLRNLPDNIQVYVPGGIFKVKDINKINKADIDLKDYDEEDFLKVYYYNEIYIPMAEEGKTYIATLIESDGKYFVDIDKGYGFKEYDPETNIVKDDTGDEILEMDKYLENINI